MCNFARTFRATVEHYCKTAAALDCVDSSIEKFDGATIHEALVGIR
jgi:hypothetical protein